MGNELSLQKFDNQQHQDLAGNVFRENRKNLKLEEEIAQRVKLADWEKLAIAGGGYVEPPQGSPEKKSQLSNMHFSDYSLYPDRFADSENQHGVNYRRSSLSEPVNAPSTAASSGIQGATVPSHLGTTPISKYNFRIRKSSVSEPSSNEGFMANDINNAGANRPRAGSINNSKLYYFDFSLIPDKDPNCTLDERQAGNGRTSRRRLYSSGDVDHLEPPTSPMEPTTPTLPAVSPPFFARAKDQDTIKEEDERPRGQPPVRGATTSGLPPRRRKTSAPPRFCFFDYSMIPDKDPRWIEKKTNKDVSVNKD